MKTAISATAVLLLALICTPAQAQSAAEQAGQQACGNDVFAMCGDAIPDRGRIEACLRRNFSRVSATCRHYMASYSRTHGAHHAERRHYTGRHYRSRHQTRRHHYDRHHYRRYYDRRHHRYYYR